MSTYQYGLKFEKSYSCGFHNEGIPLLLSSSLLRRNCAGQIDLARMVKNKSEWIIQVLELKTQENSAGRSQTCRIYQSILLLENIFDLRFEFSYVFDKE